MELVKSRPVLEQVIAVLNLDIQTEQLSQMITVENAPDTRILTIRVESEDPKEAKAIADAVRESVSIQIPKIMDADSVNTIEEGNLPTSPSSPNLMKNMALGGILGIVLAIGIIVLIYVLDLSLIHISCWTLSCTCTTVNTSISIDLIMICSLRNSSYWTFSFASATANTFITNYVCHWYVPPFCDYKTSAFIYHNTKN